LLHVGYFAATIPSSSLSGIEFLHLVQVRLIEINNNKLLLSFFECKKEKVIKNYLFRVESTGIHLPFWG
jgi:hypothetical protein